MDVRLVRIDDRLIHGQVATVWAKETGIERIIVVSDTVAKDELQKFLLIQAAPPGVKANVVPVDKMFEVFYNVLFINTKVMLLFTYPQDIESNEQMESCRFNEAELSERDLSGAGFIECEILG